MMAEKDKKSSVSSPLLTEAAVRSSQSACIHITAKTFE